MKYLAWIKENGRASPQLWALDFSNSIELKLGKVEQKYELTNEDHHLTFEELIRKYPYEEKSVDVGVAE